jgi:hypothetical protein
MTVFKFSIGRITRIFWIDSDLVLKPQSVLCLRRRWKLITAAMLSIRQGAVDRRSWQIAVAAPPGAVRKHHRKAGGKESL